MTICEDDPGFDRYLNEERAKSLSGNVIASLISEIGVAVLTVAVLWEHFPHKHLLVWLCVAIVSTAASYSIHRGYDYESPGLNGRYWFALDMARSAITGLVWGMVPVLFFTTESTSYIVWIIAIYAGYVSGSLSVTFSYTPCFRAFTLGISVPMMARMFYQDETLYNVIGLQMIFYILMLGYVSKNMHQLFIRSTRSNYENIFLLEQINREKQIAERATASKSQFLAAASHDLRQPLNAVGLFVDALHPLQSNQSGRQILDKIRLSLKSLNGMLHSLLDISRLDASAMDNTPLDLCLNTIVRQLVDEYRVKASHLDIVYQADEQVIVHADPTVLARVVRNLVDNAVKYTNQGSVTIYAGAADNCAQLLITDTGIGIQADRIDSIFDEFQQLNNPERNREKGLGLGLAIVKRLCRLANIKLEITSEFGTGTQVRLQIRLGDSAGVNKESSQDEILLQDRLVVVIDDEADILEGMESVLGNWGCKVILGGDLAQALANLEQHADVPDVLISDFRLKGSQTGIDVIEHLREEYNSEIPAILITGDTAPEQIKMAKEAACEVMYKPIESTELNAVIRKCIAEGQ